MSIAGIALLIAVWLLSEARLGLTPTINAVAVLLLAAGITRVSRIGARRRRMRRNEVAT